MIAEKIQKALNKQVNMELYSAYLYLSMAAHFQAANLTGFANWMKAQAKEELLHGMKLYDYVLDRDGRVTLEAITAPPDAWGSPLAAAEDAYRHERENTTLINDLYVLANQEGDHVTAIFLHWFVTEQVEEESSANRIVERLKLVGDSSAGLLLMDRELAARI
jgi:ferritin